MASTSLNLKSSSFSTRRTPTSAAGYGITNGGAIDNLAAVSTNGLLQRIGSSTYGVAPITGTGNVVYSASPTLTGMIAGASETLTGTLENIAQLAMERRFAPPSILVVGTVVGSVVGSVIAPVIKVCNNPQTYKNLSEDMDVNAGRIISEGASLDDVADEIVSVIENVASGAQTKSEELGHVEFVLTYKDFYFNQTTRQLC